MADIGAVDPADIGAVDPAIQWAGGYVPWILLCKRLVDIGAVDPAIQWACGYVL
jgi:hypothetical protein